MKKKVDSRIRTLIENGVRTRHRSMFVLVGDRGREQLPTLYYMLKKASSSRPRPVLWSYQKELGFTTHRGKRMRQLKKMHKLGVREEGDETPFELFVASTPISYVYHRESHRALGRTFGMCVLQDFESVTPNLLARTVETVEGGGVVVLLLKTMRSLKQLYSLSMDVHSRYRTESHQDVTGRFNERFLLSLGVNPACLVLDDELNLLPLSSHVRDIRPVSLDGRQLDEKGDHIASRASVELRELQATMRETQPVGALVDAAVTLDQAKAVLTFVEAVSEKTLRSTVVLTAARGRGKSAAMGISVAGAVAYGYSNIFVTSPSPENVGTLFQMVFKAFDALGYKEHHDYEIVQSADPDMGKAVVRVNIFREHRQTIQYIPPQDHARLAQAELLVIDEAAAIPLPLVKRLLGNYLVFMSSTVNGYEGTGRSLSLKLVGDLRRQSAAAATAGGGRTLRELTLDEPIRYAPGDPVESWLNRLLCLDCMQSVPPLAGGVPHPDQCELYYVNRDTLFSFHAGTEAFLQRMMSLYVSSHYKNSPNDLQLMSDAPAHHLFCLLGPVRPGSGDDALPDILCVLQVCLEGEISRQSVLESLARGHRASGDLIPWCVSQQYQDNDFASLSGARVVRIATHPDLLRMGYASRALSAVSDYYDGKMTNLEEAEAAVAAAERADKAERKAERKAAAEGAGSLLTEVIRPRRNTRPLLERLSERVPERLHYLGVSYGLTQSLYNFWSRAGYAPLYVRQTANDLTGEHTCIMVRPLLHSSMMADPEWMASFTHDFRRRFISLLPASFRHFAPKLALSVLDPPTSSGGAAVPAAAAAAAAAAAPPGKARAPRAMAGQPISFRDVLVLLSEYDLRRLEAYSRNLVDYHMVLDLVPALASLFFQRRVPVTLSHTQCAIMAAVGLQRKTVDTVTAELELQSNQVLALFNKAVRKISSHLRALEEAHVAAELPAIQNQGAAKEAGGAMRPLRQGLDEDLDEGAAADRAKRLERLEELNLGEFAIKGSSEEWGKALKAGGSARVPGGLSIAKDASTPSSSSKKRKGGGSEKKHKKKGSSSSKKSRKK